MDIFDELPDNLSLQYQLKRINMADIMCSQALELIDVVYVKHSISMRAVHVTAIDYNGNLLEYINKSSGIIFMAKNGKYRVNAVLVKRLISLDDDRSTLVTKVSFNKLCNTLEDAISSLAIRTVNEFLDPGKLNTMLYRIYGK